MTVTYSASNDKIKQVKQGDPLFLIKQGMYFVPRAGLEIDSKCPQRYRDIINECYNNGWLKPVAYMRDDEYLWDALKE
jgi:hypothetical protein